MITLRSNLDRGMEGVKVGRVRGVIGYTAPESVNVDSVCGTSNSQVSSNCIGWRV